MLNINMTWSEFKGFVEDRSLPIQYFQKSSVYLLAAKDDYFFSVCTITKDADIEDFEDNFKGSANVTMTDGDGRTVSKSAITTKGWIYLALFVDINAFDATSPVRAKNFEGTDYSTGVKYFDSEYGGLELVSPSQITLDTSCKRMEITLDLGFDFELIKGQIKSNENSPFDVYIDVINGIDALGMYKSFVEGCNLRTVGEIESDGKSPKRLNRTIEGVPHPANVFKIIARRPVPSPGDHKFTLVFELYRE